MNKTERINLIMRYINNRAQFTISEIMKEFNVSRATAIRDIEEISLMGFPIVAERGRGGGYSVIQNHYLPSIQFTSDELKALFISFIASKNSQLPFLQNRKSITEKLIGIANPTQQDQLVELTNLLYFENTNPNNASILELTDSAPIQLNELINLVMTDKHITIMYLKPNQKRPDKRDIYVEQIYNIHGRWYLEAFDFDKKDFRTFNIQRIQSSALPQQEQPLSEKEILELRRQKKQKNNLRLHLSGNAISRFKRMHPPKACLQYLDMFQQEAVFETYVDTANQGEMDFLADWLLFLGKQITFKQIPRELKEVLNQHLNQLKQNLNDNN